MKTSGASRMEGSECTAGTGGSARTRKGLAGGASSPDALLECRASEPNAEAFESLPFVLDVDLAGDVRAGVARVDTVAVGVTARLNDVPVERLRGR
jgi:hypothetical protein